MTESGRVPPGPWVRFSRWIKDQLVGEVPAELAACEFECKKDQCLDGQWVNCHRRIDRAAQESMHGSLKKQE